MLSTAATQGSGFELLTAAGEPAALACIRIVGPRAAGFAQRHLRPASGRPLEKSRIGELRRAVFVDERNSPIDDVVVSIHDGGVESPGGLDLRVHFHGGAGPIGGCVELLIAGGFTDLSQRADGPPLWSGACAIQRIAWRLLPQLSTLTGARWLAVQAVQLPAALRALERASPLEPEIMRAREIAARLRFAKWFTAPLRIALVGPPNAGKSTLLNALAGESVSLVSPRPGTTRDWVEAPGEIAGYPVVWVDTAGLRSTTDALESAGIELTRELLGEMNAVVAVVDGCDSDAAAFLSALPIEPVCIAANKSDLPGHSTTHFRQDATEKPTPVVALSARTGVGLDDLCAAVLRAAGRTPAESGPAAFSAEIADAVNRWAEGSPAALRSILGPA